MIRRNKALQGGSDKGIQPLFLLSLMFAFVLPLLNPALGASPGVSLMPRMQEAGRTSVIPGVPFTVNAVLEGDSVPGHNVNLFYMAFSVEGVELLGYEWNDPFPNGTVEDDSFPRLDQLPAVIDSGALAGPLIDVQFSNLLRGAVSFGGVILSVELSLPLDYEGPSLITIQTIPDSFANGFDAIDVVQGEDLRIAVNHRPRLTANAGLDISLGGEAVITSGMLSAQDEETVDAVEIVYTVGPEGRGSGALYGRLLLNNQELDAGDAFTQRDVNQGRLKYRAPETNAGPVDQFTFEVSDADGAAAKDGEFTVFNFPIRIANEPPQAGQGSGVIHTGGTFNGQLQAFDPNTYQQLTFSLVSAGSLGTASLLDETTGAFEYVANASGQQGADLIVFQVNDGVTDATAPGLFFITIAEVAPEGRADTLTVVENQNASGRMEADDPDVIDRPFQFQLIEPPSKGTVNLNADTGEYVYTPAPDRFGEDRFTFIVKQGDLISETAAVDVTIQGVPEEGDLFLGGHASGNDKGALAMVNPVNGDVYVYIEEPYLDNPIGMAYHPLRKAVYFGVVPEGDPDGEGGDPPEAQIIEIPLNGSEPRLIAQGGALEAPLGLEVGEQGNLLVANGTGSNILSVNLDTLELTVLFSGGLLQTPAGMALGENNQLYVTDLVELLQDNGKVLRIDRDTGEQTLISEDPAFLDPGHLLRLANGNYLVSDRGGVFEVDESDGSIQVIVSGDAVNVVGKQMAVNGSGDLFVVDFDNALLEVDLETGQAAPVSLEGFQAPRGIAAYVLPRTLEGWRSAEFGAANVADPSKESSLWGDLADPDGDLLLNLLEYALDLNPNRPELGEPGLDVAIRKVDDQSFVELSYKKREIDPDLTYRIQTSATLEGWGDQTDSFEAVEAEPLGEAFDRVTIRSTEPLDASVLRFFRIGVQRSADE